MKVASPLVATCGKSSKKRMSGMLCSLCHLVTPCSVLNKEESMASVRCHLSCCLMCFALGKNNYRNCVCTFQYKYLLLNLFFFLQLVHFVISCNNHKNGTWIGFAVSAFQVAKLNWSFVSFLDSIYVNENHNYFFHTSTYLALSKMANLICPEGSLNPHSNVCFCKLH